MNWKIDLTEGSSFTYQADENGRILVHAERLAYVRNLADGSGSQSATALRRAVDYARTQIPVNTAYDSANPQCLSRGYTGLGFRDRDNAARVRIEYSTPQFPGGGGGDGGSSFVVSDETDEVSDTTQFDPNTGAQLKIPWVNPNDATDKLPFYPTVAYPASLRTVVLAGLIPLANLTTFQAAVRKVNSDSPYMGVTGVGFWRFVRIRTTRTVGSSYAMLTCELKTRVDRDWSIYEVLRDSHTGRVVGVRGNDYLALKNAGYTFGVATRNGILKLGPYAVISFHDLFGIS